MPALLAYALLIAGTALSLLAFRHDLGRLRISSEVPQAAPKRIAPEVHALGAILTGVGAGLIWGGWAGVSSGSGHALVAYLVVRPLLERWSER